MAAAQPTTGGIISTISSWLSGDFQEEPDAKVVFTGTKITDNVYDLRPIEEQVEDFNVEIVFFHGLQLDRNKQKDAYFLTWVSEREPQKCWPATLLPKVFPKARLLSIKYDGAAKKSSTTGRVDLDNAVENLVFELIRNNRPFGAGVGQTRAPVILVTHCLGGLVAQKLILEVDKQLSYRPDDLKLKNFWNNLGGIVYYSPPFHGSDQFVKAASSVKTKGPLVKFMEILLKENARIVKNYTELLDSDRFSPKPPSLVIAETFSTTRDGFSGQVVQEGSARFGDSFVTVKGDHFSVCQPEDETSQSFQHLANFVQVVVKNYVFALPRPRGSSGSFVTQVQRERTSTGGSSAPSASSFDVDEGKQSSGPGEKHLRNKISFDSQTPSQKDHNVWLEMLDKLPRNEARRTSSAEWDTESTELTFFQSYDNATVMGGGHL